VAAVQRLDEVTTRLRRRVRALAALLDSLSADPEPRIALIDQLGAELRRLRERLAVDEAELRAFRQEQDTQR
jgi:hypothetical protein